MKQFRKRKIYNWVINNLEYTSKNNFLSSAELCKEYCETYKEEYTPGILRSFSMHLREILRVLDWKIKRGKHKNHQGYFYLKFIHSMEKDIVAKRAEKIINLNETLMLDTLTEINNKLTQLLMLTQDRRNSNVAPKTTGGPTPGSSMHGGSS